MSNNLRDQIYKNMNLKETDDLLDIWQANNRAKWSDDAFRAVEEILKERLGSVPAQGEPVTRLDDKEYDDDLENWEAKLLDAEDQPDFYDTVEVLDLKDNINKAAKAVVVINVILIFLFFPSVQKMFTSSYPSLDQIPQTLIIFALTALSVGLSILITYFPLKALSYVLRILMEMEFNSRKIK